MCLLALPVVDYIGHRQMIALLANFFNLVGPDFLVISIIVFVLFGIPALIALPFIIIINRRSKKPPALPEHLKE